VDGFEAETNLTKGSLEENKTDIVVCGEEG